MSTSRPFAYNTGSNINGTEQLDDLAIGIPSSGFSGSPDFWNGPDEELGYVVAYPVPPGDHPTSLPGDNLALSSTYKGVDISLSNNNQTAQQLFGYQMSVLGTTVIGAEDKVMFSVLVSLAQPATLSDSHFIGVGYTTMNYQGNPYGGFPGSDNQSVGYCSNGTIRWNGNVLSTGFTLSTWGDGDIVDIAIDNNYNVLWVRVNGGDWNNDPSSNPETNSQPIEVIFGPFYPALCPGYEGTMTVQNKAKYGIPSGYNFLGNLTASVGFWRSQAMTDESFLALVLNKTGQTFATGLQAKTWLNNNGYWTSYLSPVLSLDAGNMSSYSGSGTVWTDLVGGKTFNLINGPGYDPNDGGKFYFDASSGQYAECSTSLPNLNIWSVSVWHYYTNENVGSGMCLVTEVYPGSTSNINYSLGDNFDSGSLSSGFFDGGWKTSGSHVLTANNWYNITGTYDGSSVKLYVNGSLVQNNTHTGNPISSSGGIRLMSRWDNADYWDGYLATVDIYDKSMNAAQVSSLFNRTKSRFGL